MMEVFDYNQEQQQENHDLAIAMDVAVPVVAIAIDNESHGPNVVLAEDDQAFNEMSTAINSATANAIQKKQRRKHLFGDCALVEIIHLHDCLRGAIKALQHDVNQLSHTASASDQAPDVSELAELERRVAGRFKVIWSVFRAHSAAEDEFIWPALKQKINLQAPQDPVVQHDASVGHAVAAPHEAAVFPQGHVHAIEDSHSSADENHQHIEPEEYEEDHVNEEKMFGRMDCLLTDIRGVLLGRSATTTLNTDPLKRMTDELRKLVESLSKHLFLHLEKEEDQCMPLVAKHLSKDEINELVGKIMGKRSSDTMCKILTMAIQTLPASEREDMVYHMKQAMVGTFFERWLAMEGFWSSTSPDDGKTDNNNGNNSNINYGDDSKPAAAENETTRNETSADQSQASPKGASQTCCTPHDHPPEVFAKNVNASADSRKPKKEPNEVVSQEELQKLIRTIAANPSLTSEQKSATIQGLRDSVWQSNRKRKMDEISIVYEHADPHSRQLASTSTRDRRVTPPSAYYRKSKSGKVKLVWSSDNDESQDHSELTKLPVDNSVPLFSARELAPTYHDGAAGAVLGCPHYARSCKLRHPSSGRLYTCRLCCQQEREMPLKDQDSPLDRYAVTEVLCMKCGTLQPADKQCINAKCESKGKPYSKYHCKICNFYDDSATKMIYHCPYCNVCRAGAGLGIDFRHCMRCNACVSITDDDHVCIPQRLQGNCPICHEILFQSTEPLRGLKCGHVMHLSCFTSYMRGQTYTCPLCKKSIEDMREYFALLDAAIRMQPMPAAYSNTKSHIYCQDCGQTGDVPYHFVGCKCTHCGSYNTRELQRHVGEMN